MTSPISVLHNDLIGLQGGSSNQYYHLTSTEYTGTGTGVFARASSPTLVTPIFSGTASGSISGNAATVTTNANLTGDVTSSGNATSYSATLPLNKGGTGQTTKAAAFDALSPMTTGGDLIYGGASGTGTRLANGTAGLYLQSQGTTLAPIWASGVIANLTGPITSVGSVTSIAAQTGIGTTFAMSVAPTFTTSITTPLIIGGTNTTQSLIHKTTTGVGTTGADHIFQVGNNGATEAMRILNNGYVGFGTAAPSTPVQINGIILAKALSISGTQTTLSYFGINNSGGSEYLGVEDSAGGQLMTSGLPYASTIQSAGATAFQIGTNNTARMTISSSGSVGVGTTNPIYPLELVGNSRFLNAAGATTGFSYQNIQNTGGQIYLGLEGSTAGNLATSDLPYAGVLVTQNATPLQLGTNGVVRLTVASGGNIGIGTTAPAQALDVTGTIKSSVGILLPTSGGTATTLNAYEEGTWTPTGNGINLSSPTGKFTRIGNVVTYTGTATFPSTSDTNAASWGGLPYTSATDAASTVVTVGSGQTADGVILASSTSLTFYNPTSGAGYINVNLSTQKLTVSGSYFK
jgi:hypothetical protein